MDYTTEFQGQFSFDKLPPAEVIVRLRELEWSDGRECEGMPGSHNEWELTRDCMGLEWDGAEDFYNYVEWLEWLNDNVLKPAEITLHGSVNYSGESIDDCGVISVDNGKIVKIERDRLAGTIEELREFKKFVLEHRYGAQIIRDFENS